MSKKNNRILTKAVMRYGKNMGLNYEVIIYYANIFYHYYPTKVGVVYI
ncbi:hypothetical protein SAMN05216436_119104 [bacterium A37T11]|nr:hypothetical protein SAMN05216436_119104 [bacterium A37T11]